MKQGKKTETKGMLKKKVGELRKKVKSLAQEAAQCDSEINKLQVVYKAACIRGFRPG